MTDYGEIARELIRRNVGETHFQKICQEFGLSANDKELLNEVMSRSKLDYTLDDVVALCEEYEHRPNIRRIMEAWDAIAREAAQVSELHRKGRRT